MFAASSGGATSGRITISNTEFDGSTSWSASCNNKHYWTILLNGSKDSVTLFGNYIHHTSGRSPKVAGKATIVHAVNNMFHEVSSPKGSSFCPKLCKPSKSNSPFFCRPLRHSMLPLHPKLSPKATFSTALESLY